jgi:uncharacterized protein YcaQ
MAGCERTLPPWGSTGRTNNRNVTQMLELLSARGEVAVSGRIGRQRLWDVADRSHGTALAVRPPHPRPRAYEGSVRLRLHPGDVQAGGETPLGLLRPARAPPRRLVGKLDAEADRKARTFTVNALHEDVRFTKAVRSDLEAEIEALTAWLGLGVTRS